ncbi:hypothetical protein O3P69_005083 [Scylla paramamosain]|uniref:Uncharacterized protein n=1 Tax=Scylla paramamosain TaxID=85552 RepID=A0AAW0UBZ6_SCYPA
MPYALISESLPELEEVRKRQEEERKAWDYMYQGRQWRCTWMRDCHCHPGLSGGCAEELLPGAELVHLHGV